MWHARFFSYRAWSRSLVCVTQLCLIENVAEEIAGVEVGCEHENRICGFCERQVRFCECAPPSRPVKMICDDCKIRERDKWDALYRAEMLS